VAGDQAQALLEASSEMLDLSRTPHKALFLYGPSRSGKSTFLRLLEAVAGKENTSAVTLHSLADDKFAAARVHGKILNIASDLSAGHIEDLSIFKMLTGEDPIDANPKYGKPFKFYNQALMGFSANEIPSVGESSRAYFERMLAFKFDYSFAGHEDQTIEDRMMDELPGIFNRLVQAWQARRKRGEALNANPTVQREFEAGSDRVQQWLDEEMESLTEWDGKPVTEGMQLPAEAFDETSDAKSLRILFNAWARENGVGEMGRNTLIKRLTSKNDVVRVRVGPTRRERFATRPRKEGEEKPSDPEASEGPEASEATNLDSGSQADTQELDKDGAKASGASGSSRPRRVDPFAHKHFARR
jgi:putative DNA primase/helicase